MDELHDTFQNLSRLSVAAKMAAKTAEEGAKVTVDKIMESIKHNKKTNVYAAQAAEVKKSQATEILADQSAKLSALYRSEAEHAFTLTNEANASAKNYAALARLEAIKMITGLKKSANVLYETKTAVEKMAADATSAERLAEKYAEKAAAGMALTFDVVAKIITHITNFQAAFNSESETGTIAFVMSAIKSMHSGPRMQINYSDGEFRSSISISCDEPTSAGENVDFYVYDPEDDTKILMPPQYRRFVQPFIHQYMYMADSARNVMAEVRLAFDCPAD